MPYHSAVTRFPNDYMVAKSISTAAGIQCMGCDDNGTLTYDHAKNHPLNVDLGTVYPPTLRIARTPRHSSLLSLAPVSFFLSELRSELGGRW
jgi:hypothetical protein